jgi:hypothetical protein
MVATQSRPKDEVNDLAFETRLSRAFGQANTSGRAILSNFATIATPAVGVTTKEAAYCLSRPPKSPVPIRYLRYPQEAEIVGRVTGFAMLIAELQ